ncbi:MAG: hypothetical protein HYU68_10460 [Bacteroidetes bacterium]|nr:hypothetical protein [Bacteroidota bacterium]
MDLFELDDLIFKLGIEPTKEQLDLIFAEFKRDFINSTLIIDGLNVKIVLKNSSVEGYEEYPETFVHLITRKSKGGKRVFDKHRANKIHWIRCILDNSTDEEVIYFEYPHNKRTNRDYYWFKEGGFLVIMEKITPDYMVITSFNIDNKKNENYFEERYQWYLKNKA